MIDQNFAGATYAVIDVETTGFDSVRDRVVEVACVVLRGDRVIEEFSTLINPERPIPIETSAIHGVYDADVIYAPTLEEIEQRLRSMTNDAILVAHNAKFDLAFLPFFGERPAICTMRLAMHLVDTTSYKNLALYEALGLEGEPKKAHHAAADARVTANVLLALLRLYAERTADPSVTALIALIAQPAILGRFAFGEYRGVPVDRLPVDYLRAVLEGDSDSWPDVRYTAERELAKRLSCRGAILIT